MDPNRAESPLASPPPSPSHLVFAPLPTSPPLPEIASTQENEVDFMETVLFPATTVCAAPLLHFGVKEPNPRTANAATTTGGTGRMSGDGDQAPGGESGGREVVTTTAATHTEQPKGYTEAGDQTQDETETSFSEKKDGDLLVEFENQQQQGDIDHKNRQSTDDTTICLGESFTSIDTTALFAEIQPTPELTRPGPRPLSASNSSLGNVWGTPVAQPRSKLVLIMEEQAAEHRQQQQEQALSDEEREQLENLRIAEQAQEEEIIRLALERSLSEISLMPSPSTGNQQQLDPRQLREQPTFETNAAVVPMDLPFHSPQQRRSRLTNAAVTVATTTTTATTVASSVASERNAETPRNQDGIITAESCWVTYRSPRQPPNPQPLTHSPQSWRGPRRSPSEYRRLGRRLSVGTSPDMSGLASDSILVTPFNQDVAISQSNREDDRIEQSRRTWYRRTEGGVNCSPESLRPPLDHYGGSGPDLSRLSRPAVRFSPPAAGRRIMALPLNADRPAPRMLAERPLPQAQPITGDRVTPQQHSMSPERRPRPQQQMVAARRMTEIGRVGEGHQISHQHQLRRSSLPNGDMERPFQPDHVEQFAWQRASEHLSPKEIEDIQRALMESEQSDRTGRPHEIALTTLTVDHVARSRLAFGDPSGPIVQNVPHSLAGVESTRPQEQSPSHMTKPAIDWDLMERYNLNKAAEHLSDEELSRIQDALRGSASVPAAAAAASVDSPFHSPKPTSAGTPDWHDEALSPEESAAIERALMEADAEEERKSVQLALHILEQETAEQAFSARSRVIQQQGNVRTMTRAEYHAQQFQHVGAFHSSSPPRLRHPLEEAEETRPSAGFRMNTTAQQEWNRRGQNTIVGPNNETRTKHDTEVQAQANARRLGLDSDDNDRPMRIGNAAYNSFIQASRRSNSKGVASHGTGRAGSDSTFTREGAMDPEVLLHVSRAINSGLIEKCNGVVKEGKEAVIYHADGGGESEGFDVAVKVFKRINEFRGRSEYVDGDSRYASGSFRNAKQREQLEMWTEKEFRNLTRAHRNGVPVPKPILHKETILFMRFLGQDGWPSPQLRELELRRGSSRWTTLYMQVMEAVASLFKNARLIHGDLSEYNVLAVPAFLVENKSSSIENDREDLQAVLIDFGQAVDVHHPEAMTFLKRDLTTIQSFFSRMGVSTMSDDEALDFILEGKALKSSEPIRTL